MNKNAYALSLKGDAFNAFKSDFDQILHRTLSTMQQKEGEKAEIKVSMKISLAQDYAPDHEIYTHEAEREIVVPKFEHRISSVMQYKEEKSGTLGGADYELVWDKNLCEFIMRKVGDGQTSLFDDPTDSLPEDVDLDELDESADYVDSSADSEPALPFSESPLNVSEDGTADADVAEDDYKYEEATDA